MNMSWLEATYYKYPWFAGGHGHHGRGFVDPFELFRSFFGTGDPFNAFDHFGMHSHHHPHHLNSGRTDPWYRRHLLAKRLRLFCPKISPEYTDPKILSNIQRTTSCWLWYRLPALKWAWPFCSYIPCPFLSENIWSCCLSPLVKVLLKTVRLQTNWFNLFFLVIFMA